MSTPKNSNHLATTKTEITNVYDAIEFEDGSPVPRLRVFGDNRLSENASIEFDDLPVFESLGNFMRTDTRKLSIAIHRLYSKTFHDLDTVDILFDPSARTPESQFILQLTFKDNTMPCPEDKIKNVVSLTEINSETRRSYLDISNAITNRSNGRQYTLTEETKLLLQDIVFGGKNNHELQPDGKGWNKYIRTVPQQTGNPFYNSRAFTSVVVVSGCFNIHYVLRKVYGDNMVVSTQRVDDGDGKSAIYNNRQPADYTIRYIKPAIGAPNVHIVHVEQFNRKAVDEFTMQEQPQLMNNQFMGWRS